MNSENSSDQTCLGLISNTAARLYFIHDIVLQLSCGL